ncbi:MAG TPA: hypothetical protein VFW40_00130, partial [Capsulimonadaceae bacterium]|nr:hypothetical protein [Capsulimonadaceae bacterium]
MNNRADENRIAEALREGLRAQPVPQTGADFDDRVLAALRNRPWWQALWLSARPIVSTAACSMIAMLAILHFSLQPPAPAFNPHPATNPPLPTGRVGVAMAALDKALDRPDLSFGTISLLLAKDKTD